MQHDPPINLQIRILPYGVADVLDPERVALVVDIRSSHPETRGTRSTKFAPSLYTMLVEKRMNGSRNEPVDRQKASRADPWCRG
jgi:hypothetical protein